MADPEVVVRLPRHNVKAVEQIEAWIAGDEGDQPWHASATLVDVSRHGCRLVTARAVSPGTSVRIIFDQPEAERQAEALGEVRWQHAKANGLWEHGLKFSRELEWEFLGELFLSGVLEIRASTSRPIE